MKTKTIQQILVLALIALGSFYAWVETRPVKTKSIPPLAVVDNTPTVEIETVTIGPPQIEPVKPVAVPKGITKPATTEVIGVHPTTPKFDYDLLPEGEFYVKEKVSEVTPTGVKAFGVGEKVFKIAGGYTNGRVTLGDNIVSGDKLTRSRSEGLALIQSVSKVSAPPVLANDIPKETVVPGTPVHVNEAKVVPQNPGSNPRVLALEAQLVELYSELRRLQDKYATTSKVNASGPVIQRVQNQIKKVEAERDALLK